MASLSTPLTELLGVKHPVMLAGMDMVAGPELVAAVINAGGFGTLGGARYTPSMLRDMIADMKNLLVDKNATFGVDLLIPQVGGSARKTNVSYPTQCSYPRRSNCKARGITQKVI
jgi:NAD(P)H-dependent flavin oxidoreductase YrpB (nitropropane dioxygenase family)